MNSLIGLLLMLAVTSQADTKVEPIPQPERQTLQERLESGADLKDTSCQKCETRLEELRQIKTFLEDINFENDGLIANVTSEMFTKATNMSEEGNNMAALRIMKQVAAVRHIMYGEENVETLDALDWVAFLNDALGLHYQALAIWLQTLQKRRYVLGPDHDNTMQTINNIGATLNDLNRNTEALVYLNEAIEKRTQVLGPDSEDTLTSLSNKANVLEDLGRKDESLALFKLVLEKRKKVLGKDHSDTKTSEGDVARVEAADH